MPSKHKRNVASEQALAHQAQRRRYFLIGSVVVAIILVAIVWVWQNNSLPVAPPAQITSAVDTTTGPSVCGPVQAFPSQGNDHIQPDQSHPPYSTNPPTSGWHWANPQEWGIYTTPQVQEQLVHNLEHGGIVVQYRDLSSEEIKTLTALVIHDRYHRLLAPYPGLPEGTKVALTAWAHLQNCNGINEEALRAFTEAYRDKGPELVP
jgi:hypothetical protein